MVQEYLCWEAGQATYGWCTYEAIDNNTAVLEIFYLGCLGLFGTVILRYLVILHRLFRKRVYQKLFGHVYFVIFYILLVWAITSIGKVVLNIAIYYTYMYQDQYKLNSITTATNNPLAHSVGNTTNGIDYGTGQPIVYLASVFQFLDTMNAFLVLLLIQLIPYQWLNMILLNTRQSQLLSLQLRVSISWYFRILKAVKYYILVLRNLFPLFLIAQPFLLFFTDIGCGMSIINTWVITLESFVIIVFYGFGYYVARRMQKYNLIWISSTDAKRIYTQYFILLAVLLSRIIFNTVFKILRNPEQKYMPTMNCFDSNVEHRHKTLIFLILAKTIMQMLPITVVILIYRPTVEIRKRYEGILRDRHSLDSDELILQYTAESESSETSYPKINQSSKYVPITAQPKRNTEGEKPSDGKYVNSVNDKGNKI